MTEIELFDFNCKKIKLEPSNLKFVNCGGNASINAHRMLNGIYLTTDEWNMWTTGLPDFWKILEI